VASASPLSQSRRRRVEFLRKAHEILGIALPETDEES
jgi:hypothetical protein